MWNRRNTDTGDPQNNFNAYPVYIQINLHNQRPGAVDSNRTLDSKSDTSVCFTILSLNVSNSKHEKISKSNYAKLDGLNPAAAAALRGNGEKVWEKSFFKKRPQEIKCRVQKLFLDTKKVF